MIHLAPLVLDKQTTHKHTTFENFKCKDVTEYAVETGLF